MVNFKNLMLCSLQSVSTLIQTLAVLLAISLPMYCGGNNQISLTNSPNAEYHTCVVWYGQPTCWGAGKFIHFMIFGTVFQDMMFSVKVVLVNWVKGILWIIGILRQIQSV